MSLTQGSDGAGPATVASRDHNRVDRGSTEPAAVGIDLGSGHTRIWASGRPLVQSPTISDSLTNPKRLMRRGRITDTAALQDLLVRLIERYGRPLPTGATIVACRPVLSTPNDDHTVRQLLTETFNPSHLLFTSTVRAAAIGAGAAPGPVLVADVGAQLSEVAFLANGALLAARRATIGLDDLIGTTAVGTLARTLADLIEDLRRDPRCRAAGVAARRGLLLVGGGATLPELAARTARALKVPVRPIKRPRVAATHGAGLAALAALRRAPTK